MKKSPVVIEPPGDILEWRVFPAAERFGAALVTLAVIAAFASLAALLMESPVWGLLAGALLLLALNRFFLPSRFRIDEAGITARYPHARQYLSWADVRRFRHDERGGYLSSRARSSLLDAFQGMHVQFGSDAPLVVARIRRHLPAEVGPPCNG